MKILGNTLLLSISTLALSASAQQLSPSPLFGADEELVGTTAYAEGQLIVRFDRKMEADEAPPTLQQGRYVLEEPLVPELGIFLYLIADGRSVALLVLKTGQRISGASIKSQCYEDYFYGDDCFSDGGDDGGPATHDLSHLLMQPLRLIIQYKILVFP